MTAVAIRAASEATPPARPTLTLVTDTPVAPTHTTVRVTGQCVACRGVYINDLAWRRADAEQRDAWTVHGIGPHAGNGLCVGCVAPEVDVSEAVIERLTVDLSEKVARHLAGEEVGLVKSRHVIDISAETAVDIWDVFATTYGEAPGDWRRDRACGGQEDLIFTERRAELAQAKTLCGGCPVQGDCLGYALRQPGSASIGVWGGMHQKALKGTRLEIKREAYRRNGMKIGKYGNPVPLDV